jgi:hypothetical protein
MWTLLQLGLLPQSQHLPAQRLLGWLLRGRSTHRCSCGVHCLPAGSGHRPCQLLRLLRAQALQEVDCLAGLCAPVECQQQQAVCEAAYCQAQLAVL